MTKIAALVACGWVVALLPGHAAPADPFAALEVAVQREVDVQARQSPAESGERRNLQMMSASSLAQIRRMARRDYDAQQIEEQLDQLTLTFRSEAVRTAAAQLRSHLAGEREAREKAFVEKLRAEVDFAAKAVRAARRPADLDEALQRLADVRERSDRSLTDTARAEVERVQSARVFVVSWQDYLSAQAAGDRERALSGLQSAGSSNILALLPRSEVLARIEQISKAPAESPAKLAAIVGGNVTLANLPAAVAALDAVIETPNSTRRSGDDPAFQLRERLRALLETHRSYEAGLPASFLVGYANFGGRPGDPEVLALALPPKIELMRLVFPEFLGTTDRPQPEETIQSYLDRVRASAAARLDAGTLARAIELQSRIEGRNDAVPAVLQTLVTARNQAEAGQFAPAVISYQVVLKSGGDIVPAKEIGARLAAIKASHPAEYEAGMQRFLSGAESAALGRSGFGGSNNGLAITIPGRESAPPLPDVSPKPTSAPVPAR